MSQNIRLCPLGYLGAVFSFAILSARKDDFVDLCAWALDQGRDGCLIEALLGQLVYASLNLAYTTLLVRHFASQNVTKDQNTLLSKKCRKKEDTLLERVLQK